MFKQNCLGGNFENGKHTPRIVRQRIVRKYGQGVSISQISKDLQVTEWGVQKIISSYEETGSIDPKLHLGQDHYKTTDNVLQHIEYIKTQKPCAYGREIKDKLLDLGVCDNETVPSRQTISHVLRHELGFSRNCLTVIPEELLTVAAQAKQVRYLEEIADFPPQEIFILWMNVAN